MYLYAIRVLATCVIGKYGIPELFYKFLKRSECRANQDCRNRAPIAKITSGSGQSAVRLVVAVIVVLTIDGL
jgi:hypothetical protein